MGSFHFHSPINPTKLFAVQPIKDYQREEIFSKEGYAICILQTKAINRIPLKIDEEERSESSCN
jgi:hypothetical protein